MFDPAIFGARVEHALQRRGLTYRKAAAEIGMDHVTLHRIARGFTPTVESYLRIESWLAKQSGKKGKP
jgi:transcriptional regulator with XRE-family HTH domain